jgi:tRNA(adenine34) deaminase
MDSSLHVPFMRRCLALALIARQNGESAVGSLVVRDGAVIGEGIEASRSNLDITYHAEIEAIRAARKALQAQHLAGCTLYTTHEPCLMCSYVIRQARISLVVIGCAVPETGGFSSPYPLLTATDIAPWGGPPDVVMGILAEDCRAVSAR